MTIITGRAFSVVTPVKQSPIIIVGDSTFPGDASFTINNFKEGSTILLSADIGPDKKKKIISAMLAFPFPFGFMGAHRVMLGCKPWIPVVYMATFGGCFGLLPMIDFCVILFSKDIAQFENNPHVFMWLK